MKINQFSRHFLAKFYYQTSSLLFSFLITKKFKLRSNFISRLMKNAVQTVDNEQKSITNISTCYVGSQLLLMT